MNDIIIKEREISRYKLESGSNLKTIQCTMVLRLMDTARFSNNYCESLEIVLDVFPGINREELEKELDKYI